MDVMLHARPRGAARGRVSEGVMMTEAVGWGGLRDVGAAAVQQHTHLDHVGLVDADARLKESGALGAHWHST